METTIWNLHHYSFNTYLAVTDPFYEGFYELPVQMLWQSYLNLKMHDTKEGKANQLKCHHRYPGGWILAWSNDQMAKPLPEPMLTYCQLDGKQQTLNQNTNRMSSKMPAISFKVYVLNISILACIYCFITAAFMVSLYVSIDRPQDSVAVNNQTWQVC